MEAAVLGGGYVGLATAVVLAEQGHRVDLVEADPDRRAALEEGRPPFHEPGMEPALGDALGSGRLTVSASLGKEARDLVLVCVGTPSGPDGAVDLGQVRSAVEEAAPVVCAWDPPGTVVVKSTVPPGTTRNEVLPLLQAHGEAGEDFGLAANPEFLREGSALDDARDPDRIVVGPVDDLAEEALRDLYAGWDAPLVVVSPEAAEAIKYASNAMLAARLALANEIANLCEAVGCDIDEVMDAVGMDPRIGPDYLRAGPGFGGSCLPKDLRALRAAARDLGVDTHVLDAVLAHNEAQPLRLVDLVRRAWGVGPDDDLGGRRVALLGVAFKPGTDDVRETRALSVHEALEQAGCDVVVHDPRAGEAYRALKPGAEVAATVEEALDGADACILHTAWPEYLDLSPGAFAERMGTPAVVDARRALDREALETAGVAYVALGRGNRTR